mgnify:FL=1
MYIIAYDLGTGGVKASLYDEKMQTLAKSFISYKTYYPADCMHEQCPEDWWNGVIKSTKILLDKTEVSPGSIGCLALSGHSLVTVPIGPDGQTLLNRVPIWSDTRALQESRSFFEKIDEKYWYMTTGNGFPAPCYSLFKLMWMKQHQPEVFERIYKVLGSKDYINYKLTGNFYTDPSYASGTGAYSLTERKMRLDFLEAAGIVQKIFPPIVPSHQIIGHITPEASKEIGLSEKTLVACGGVDNACMALGAVGPEDGKIYTSLGSSSWVPVNSRTPILDFAKKPYVFAHIQENMFTSAFSIFAGGSSFAWTKDIFCKDITENVYDRMSELASQIPIGSGGVFFNPSLAGGTSQDKSLHIRGAFIGLHLGTTREAMIRAAMEGICMNLKESIRYLQEKTAVTDEILFCGGGSKSKFWMQRFADVFNMNIIKTNIDQDAASLGAACIAARASGLWQDYSPVPLLHHIEYVSRPVPEHAAAYERLQTTFTHICDVLADLGDYMSENGVLGTSAVQ